MAHLSMFAFLKERKSRIKIERFIGALFFLIGVFSIISSLIYIPVRIFSSETMSFVFFFSNLVVLATGLVFSYVGYVVRNRHYCRFCLGKIDALAAECPHCREDLTSTHSDIHRPIH